MSVKEITEKEFEEKVENAGKKVVVDCYAEWCGPCKMLSPIIDQLADEVDTIDFYKLNADESEEVMAKYGIMSIPTLLIFENKELKAKLVGFKSKDELKRALED